MFGWEFPPHNCGGLGTACLGLTKSLVGQGAEITFVVPHSRENTDACHMKMISTTDEIQVKYIPSLLRAYTTSQSYKKEYEMLQGTSKRTLYGQDLFAEVERYAKAAGVIAENENFDVIHCHDWLTFGAGLHAKNVSGKPLVMHVHATEFDRTGGNGVNQMVYETEKYGMEHADKIVAVSGFVKKTIMKHYGIPDEKIHVVHNGVDWYVKAHAGPRFRIYDSDKVVLFVGRITLQKGPEYFVYAAKRVLEVEPHVKFVMVGSGDMETFVIQKAAELGIADKVLFTGFLRGADLDKAYQMADVFVMPSVSEPFGIVPLEALKNGTPVIISKQSGVSEILSGALKVDFWDTEKMANHILATLSYDALHTCLKHDGMSQGSQLSWDGPASKCIQIYSSLCL